MINENVKRIIEYKKDQSDFHKEMIFTTIRSLGSCFPHEIKQDIDKLSRLYAEGKYENGQINKNEVEKLFKENTVRRETIQRKLKEMVNEGSITKNNDGRYSISELAKSDLRYFNPESGRNFGELLLNSLLMLHFPTIDDFKTNIDKLISIFGFYLIYSLIEACRPIKIEKDDKYIENRAKDSLAEKWFEQVVNSNKMLGSFVATVTNQYTDEQRKEYLKKHCKKKDENSGFIDYLDNPPDPIRDPMSAIDFCYIQFLNNTSEETYNRYRTTSNPSYELNNKCIDEIISILQDLYPEYYDIALQVRSYYLGRPKEGSLKDRQKDFRFFNSETEDFE